MRRPLTLAAVPVAILAVAAGLLSGMSPTSGRAIAQQPPEFEPAPARRPAKVLGRSTGWSSAA